MGIRRFLPEQACGSIISSLRLPDGVSCQQLHDLLKKEGFVIYAGQAGLYHSIFRIANMGAIADGDLERLLGVFRKRFGAAGARAKGDEAGVTGDHTATRRSG